MSTPFDSLPLLHGTLRGSDDRRRSRTFEGRFGRMFRNLPPAEFSPQEPASQKSLPAETVGSEAQTVRKPRSQDDALIALAETMFSPSRSAATSNRTTSLGTEPAPSQDSEIPAGYTYLGQFIDHDLTFDPVTSLQRDNDPQALVNYRTPRFDLDSVYARGPDDQPYLYEPDGIRMRLGVKLGEELADGSRLGVPLMGKPPDVSQPEDRDLWRNSDGRAIIADPRNDQHVIIAQLHALVLRFHNRVADELKNERGAEPKFAEVQRLVRWHYQWVIMHDFLKSVVNKETYDEVLPHIAKKSNPVQDAPKLKFFDPQYEAFIPVEFSAAAYRFGHAMVRKKYRLNRSEEPTRGGPFKILGTDRLKSLVGFRQFRKDWVIDWSLFFERLATPQEDGRDVQRANKIDKSLSDPLQDLPFQSTKDHPSLAERTLIRGRRLGLPSGQAVARAMGVTPLTDDEIFGADVPPVFKENAPLWYYVLAEAGGKPYNGNKLGPVGGRIVMETVVGLMLEDGHSFLCQDPLWKPCQKFCSDGTFEMPEFIRAARGAPAQPQERVAK